MSLNQFRTALLVAAALLTVTQSPKGNLEYVSADQFTLYSIDGSKETAAKNLPGPKFHGHLLLGQVEVEQPSLRRALLLALQEGQSENDQITVDCFRPRHALRVRKGDKVTDYVLCFECRQFQIVERGLEKWNRISRSPQPVFTAMLKAANLPLAHGLH